MNKAKDKTESSHKSAVSALLGTRTFKFRAWDERNAQMLYKISVADGGGHVWVPEDEIQIMTSTTHYEDAETGYWLLSSFKLMQFTGLHDKNGKEIYEGDIVLLKDGIPRGDGQYDDDIFVVKYDKNQTAFIGKNKFTDEYLGHLEPDEIIGNIFENPELLECT